MRCLEILEKAMELPMGHYEIRRAKLLVETEYQRSQEQERKWARRPKYARNRYLHKKECLDFMWKVCTAVGERPPRLVVNSRDVLRYSGGFYSYDEKKIHFSHYFPLWTISLIHELTHHCGPDDHGDDFLEIEELLFEAGESVLPY